MNELLLVAAGLLAGGLAGWFWASGRARAAEGLLAELRRQLEQREAEMANLRGVLESERTARTRAEARLEEAARNIEEQRRLLEEARSKLSETFRAASQEVLASNKQDFLQLAKQVLETIVAESKGDLGQRQEAISGLIRPLQESLKRYEEQIRVMEEGRQKAYGSLEKQIESLGRSQLELQQQTANLVTALRHPQVRGRWGEITLRRVVELAGMSAHCDYTEQVSVNTEEGRLRPDLVVHLPAGREIVVDAKVSLDAYLKAVSAADEKERQEALSRHAAQVREHMNRLAGKSYWSQFPAAPEFVVMFLPGESFFAAAVDCDRCLIEDGMAARVVLATPTTLIALLRSVAYGWRQQQLADNARHISGLGKEIYERLGHLAKNFDDLGKSLAKAIENYNKAVFNLESKVLVTARRFRELGATSGEEIPPLAEVQQGPRSVEPTE